MKVNKSLILAIASCLGVVGVAVAASHDSKKAKQLVEKAEYEPVHELKTDLIEETKIAWSAYIPTGMVAISTIAAIIFNQRLTSKQLLVLSSAAAASGGLVRTYREKIEEVVGKENLQEITRRVARTHESEINKGKLVSFGMAGTCPILEDTSIDADTIFYDEESNTWFKSSLYNVKNAMYYFNRDFARTAMAPMEDFYRYLGIECPEQWAHYGYGFSHIDDDGHWIDFDLTESEFEDTGEKYYIISTVWEPTEWNEDEGCF